jgi:hypothetical protein
VRAVRHNGLRVGVWLQVTLEMLLVSERLQHCFVIFISDKSCIAVKIQQKFIVMTALLILWFDTCQQIVCNACTTLPLLLLLLLLIMHCNPYKVLACSTTFFQLSLFCATFLQLHTFMFFISSKTLCLTTYHLSKVHCSCHVVHMLWLLLLLLQWWLDYLLILCSSEEASWYEGNHVFFFLFPFQVH